MIKTGRPRLDDTPGFKEAFAALLPRLLGGEISQGQAARELGISVRSLKRYAKYGARDVTDFQKLQFKNECRPRDD